MDKITGFCRNKVPVLGIEPGALWKYSKSGLIILIDDHQHVVADRGLHESKFYEVPPPERSMYDSIEDEM